MPRQISGRPDGANPLIYTGSVPNMVIKARRPNAGDVAQYEIGYWWVIPKQDSSPTEEIWVLVSKDNNIATWKRMGGSSSSIAVNKIYLNTAGSGIYTPTTGMIQAYIEIIGGGGSGNTVNTNFSVNFTTNAAGGAGAYCAKLYTAAQIGASQSYVIGTGGIAPTANANADGVDGTNTIFMSMIAGGGKGAVYDASGYSVPNAAVGGIASGGDINTNGESALYGLFDTGGGGSYSVLSVIKAGSSFYGTGAYIITVNSSGLSGLNGSNGSGGGAATYFSGGGAGYIIGGNGGDGMIVITEYIA